MALSITVTARCLSRLALDVKTGKVHGKTAATPMSKQDQAMLKKSLRRATSVLKFPLSLQKLECC